MKQVLKMIKNYIRDTDFLLLLLCSAASVISVVLLLGLSEAGMIYNGERVVKMQILAIGLGITAAVVLSAFDYRLMARLWKLHVPAAYLLVVLTFFFGKSRGEADDRAWLEILGFSLQPTELLKISFILSFSLHLEKVREEINRLRHLILLLIHGGIPVLLIHFQGDDGTALVFAIMMLCMLFSAGLSWKYIFLGLGAAAASAPLLWFRIFSDDQRNRVLALFHQDDPAFVKVIGWQQYLGRIAIGAGQVWGTGIFSDTPPISVPEVYNDFIFAFIGESMGFIGCIGVLLLLMAICFRILFTARLAQDYLGKFVCVGLFSVLMSQVVINVGMCLSVLPVVGITLPFFSAGGTSVTTLYLGIGLTLSIYRHSRKNQLFY